MSVSLSPCTIPGSAPSFSLAEDEIELGLGMFILLVIIVIICTHVKYAWEEQNRPLGLNFNKLFDN
jgi:hypothetical protein